MSGSAVELLVEEPAEEEVVGDGVDVREAGEVADDRGHRGAPPAPRRQQRAGGCRPADLHGDLARELQQVAVQQEEAGEAERADDPQLLLQPGVRGGMVGRAGRIALGQPGPAELGELARRLRVLRAGVAVPEVGAAGRTAGARRGRRSPPPRPRGPRSARPWRRGRRARGRCCRGARAPTRPASGGGAAPRTRPAAARACGRGHGRCPWPRWGRPAAGRAPPARGCVRGRGAGTGAGARPGSGPGRTRRAAGAASARRGCRGPRSRSGRRARRRTPPASPAGRRAAARQDAGRARGRA